MDLYKISCKSWYKNVKYCRKMQKTEGYIDI